MKHMRSFALTALCMAGPAEAALQGYWTFDNNYNDTSGNARNAASPGGTADPLFSPDVAPQLAGAGTASLDMRNRTSPTTGTNCYATVPGSGTQFNFSGPATVSCWVKGWPADTWVPFLAKNGEPNGWQIRRNGATPEADWTTRGTSTGFATGNGDFATNGWGWATQPGEASKQARWQHYCAVWDGTNKRVYINGQLAAVQANAGAHILDSPNLLVFGGRQDGANTSAAISGFSRIMLDNVAIWDEALSSAQIDDLSRGGSPLALRTTYWPYGAGEPWGGNGTMGVRMTRPAIVNGLHDVVNGIWNNAGIVDNSTATRLSFGDPNSPGGALAGYTTYYNNTAADDDNFGQVVTGCFRVAAGQGGQYTFYCNGDDGFQLVIFGATWEKFYGGNAQTTISGESFHAPLPTGGSNAYGVVTLQPGDYNFRYTWFEQGGGAFNNVQVGPGDKSATDATFKVLGDPAMFTLVPQKPVLTFRTSNDTIVAGAPANVTLSWDNKFTTALTLSPTPPGNPVLTAGKSSVTIPSPSTTTTYTLTGTNGAQSTSAQLTVFVDQPPVISSFTVNDSTVVSGAPITFSYNVVGAQSLSINNGVGSVTPLTVGTKNISAPATTTTYILTATNGFGSVTSQVTVNIGPPPVISSFTVDDSLVMPGGTAGLHWNVSTSDSRTITPRPGSVAASGDYFDSISATTVYTLTATNVYAVVSQNVTVNVPPPISITPAGWSVRRISAGTTVATLATCDQLLSGALAGTTFTQSGLPRINFGDSATGVLIGGETLPPGGNGDNFVVECTATLQVVFPGSYTFGINNDDGGRLRIDGADVIVDDTNHGPTSFTASKTLTAGTHTINYLYWEQTGGMAGEAFWVKSDGTALLLDNTAVSFAITTPTVIISEFQADNSGTIEDRDGQASDWIELFNGTAAPVSLAGYYLTDDALLKNKWAFPAGAPHTLQPGEYFLVFASSKNTVYPGDEYHTNFKLADTGGYLALTKDDGAGGFTVVQEFNPYPAQRKDRSYGLYDTELRTGYFAQPTPRGTNVAGYAGFVGDTHFSVHRGLKPAAFTLAITADEPTAQIRYTTDGSTPTPLTGTVYSGPFNVSATAAIRAAAFKVGWYPSNVDTHTYVFPADVINQSQATALNAGWPVGPVAGQILDYGMDSRVTGPNSAAVIAGLQSIPSIAITTDIPNLLDPNFGIYVNSNLRGEQFERPASFEILNDSPNADNTTGTVETHIDCGLRIRGGYSRSDTNPKHAFRLFFGSQYDGPFNYRLFGKEGTTSFKNLDIQCPQNYSWSYDPSGATPGGAYQANTFLRELSARDTQRAMDQPYTRTRHYHLYVNGIYWGIFASQERAENAYGASYLGGKDNDYDVVKSSGSSGGYLTEATDGTMLQGTSATPGSAWARLWFRARELRTAAATETDRTTRYFQLQSLAANGVTPLNPATDPRVLDPDNLADYLLTTFYCGSFDAPMSTFLSNASNNWFGMRDRLGSNGFKFFCHDFEHGMGSDSETSGSRSRDRTGPWGGSGTNYKGQAMYNTVGDYTRSNPHYVHEDLAFSKEYRVRFGDRAHRALFNTGALTNASVISRINARAAILDPVIVCESARWGDSKSANPFTKTDWLSAKTRLTNWITFGSNEDLAVSSGPGRTARIVQQLRAYKDKASGTSAGAGDATLVSMPLYPLLDAPVYSQNGGVIPQGGSFTMTNPNTTGDVGVIYYRLDELDPRAIGGGIRAGSLTVASGGSVVPTQSGLIRARVYQTSTQEWSAMNEFPFVIGVPASSANLVVSEINYNPRGPLVAPATDRDNYEFVELLNISAADTIQLDGVKFDTGISFDFTTQSSISSLAPGARCVLVSNLAAFQQRYPDASYPGLSAKIAGTYTGQLDNGGEQLILKNLTTGQDIANFSYDDAAPWPTEADGNGKTIYLTCTNPGGADKNLATSWYEHLLVNGNPGGVDCGYELWASANGASANGLGDADNDGLADVLEYVLGSSTASSSANKVPTASVQDLVVGVNPPAGYLTMTVTQAPVTPDVQIIAETATSLTGWSADAVLVTSTTNGDGSITRVYRAPVPFAADVRRQMRIRVVKP